jgi:hypothetical protein
VTLCFCWVIKHFPAFGAFEEFRHCFDAENIAGPDTMFYFRYRCVQCRREEKALQRPLLLRIPLPAAPANKPTVKAQFVEAPLWEREVRLLYYL